MQCNETSCEDDFCFDSAYSAMVSEVQEESLRIASDQEGRNLSCRPELSHFPHSLTDLEP